MNILFIHEIDWLRKVVFDIHNLSELLALRGHNVFAIDCRQASLKKRLSGLKTEILHGIRRAHEGSSVTLIRPGTINIPILNRATAVVTHYPAIKRTIIDNDIDAVVLYSAPTNGLQAIHIARESGIPVMFRAMDVLHKLVNFPILQSMVRVFESVVYRKTDKVLASTLRMTRYAINMGASKERVSLLPNGVDINVFKPSAKNKELMNNLGLSGEDKVVVFVGTLFEFSGVDRLVSGFTYLKRAVPDVKFLIVGGGPILSWLQESVRRKGLGKSVLITGVQPYELISTYINLATVCVNPFEINPVTDDILPIKLLQYLACRKPVVSTPLTGAKEMLPGRESGVVYAEPSEFLFRLEELLNDPTEIARLGQRGLAYVRERYAWTGIVDTLETILKGVVNGRKYNR